MNISAKADPKVKKKLLAENLKEILKRQCNKIKVM